MNGSSFITAVAHSFTFLQLQNRSIRLERISVKICWDCLSANGASSWTTLTEIDKFEATNLEWIIWNWQLGTDTQVKSRQSKIQRLPKSNRWPLHFKRTRDDLAFELALTYTAIVIFDYYVWYDQNNQNMIKLIAKKFWLCLSCSQSG